MASLEITDQQLEQLVSVYLNKHSNLPGAPELLEYLSQLKEISEELIGFDRDLAQRLTVLRHEDGENKMYRLRIRSPLFGTLYNVYFMVVPDRVTYYMFLDGGFVDYYDHGMYTALKSLITITLKPGSTNSDEDEFTKGYQLKKNGRNSPKRIYQFTDFPSWNANRTSTEKRHL